MIYQGDCIDILPTLETNTIQCCVTSPPYYGLRDYGCAGQIGLEGTPDEYVAKLVDVFREVRRVLRDDGVLFLNLGDSYAGGKQGRDDGGDSGGSFHGQPKHDETKPKQRKAPIGLKPKNLIGIPWRVAFALQADGWYLRQDIIWHKPNPMPESVTDRCTKAHEYVFLLAKSAKYYFDGEAIKEPTTTNDDLVRDRDTTKLNNVPGRTRMAGLQTNNYNLRNKRSVWTVTTKPFKEAHFATFPPEIPEICIKAGSKKGDTILDPFSGAGTTGVVAEKLGRKYIGIELNPQYTKLAEDRIYNVQPLFAGVNA